MMTEAQQLQAGRGMLDVCICEDPLGKRYVV